MNTLLSITLPASMTHPSQLEISRAAATRHAQLSALAERRAARRRSPRSRLRRTVARYLASARPVAHR